MTTVVVDAIKIDDFLKNPDKKNLPLYICAGKSNHKIDDDAKKILDENYISFKAKDGSVTYVNGIIEPKKCNKIKCKKLKINGKKHTVTSYDLEKCPNLNGKKVIVAHTEDGNVRKKISTYMMLKHVRLKAYAINKKMNLISR